MTPREMVSELLALMGDPAAQKIPEPLALRMLNDAQLTIANMLYPFYPALFRTVTTTSSDDGSTVIFSIPTACAKLERVSVDSSTDVETDAIEIPLKDWGATISNQFYTGAMKEGQVFYTHRGDNKLEFTPAPPSGKDINFYYQKRPTEMRYDYGHAVTDNVNYYFTDETKTWGATEWSVNTSYARVLENLTAPQLRPIRLYDEYLISSNNATVLRLASQPLGLSNNDIVDYEVYTPSDIPKKYHPLIVKQALANNDGTRAEQLKSEIEKEFMLMVGGSYGG